MPEKEKKLSWVEKLKNDVIAFFSRKKTSNTDMKRMGFTPRATKQIRKYNRGKPLGKRLRPSLGQLDKELKKQGR